jgi:hypothetical protein
VGYLLHANRERRFRARLLHDGGRNVVVVSVPWQLQPGDTERAIGEDGPTAEASLRAAAASEC